MECASCGGELVPRTQYRLGRVAVAAGYLVLLPALVTLPVAGGMFVYGWWEYGQSSDDLFRHMREAGLPKAVIQKAQRGEYLPDERRRELTFRQRWAYDMARERHEPLWGMGYAFSLMMYAFIFGAALVGMLLVRKREVLECGQCDSRRGP